MCSTSLASASGLRNANFAACVEWVLENIGLYFSVCPDDEDIFSPTPKLETSQPSSRCTELLPEPTADVEPEPAATEPTIPTEPEPLSSSDQVREPATLSVPEGVLVVIKGLEGSPVHIPATEGELQLVSGSYIEELLDIFNTDLIDWFGEVLPCTPESPTSPLVPSSPESPAPPLVLPSSCPPVFPPNLPLPLPLKQDSPSPPSPLMHVSPSAHPQSAPAMRSDPPHRRDFQSPVLPSRADPVSTSILRALDYTLVLRPIGSALAPSSHVSTVAHYPTSSTGLPRPSSSALVSCRPSAASGLHSSGFISTFHPSGSGRLLPFSSNFILRHTGLPDPCLRLSRQSIQLRLGPPDPQFCPGSPSARFHLGLHLQWLSLCQSAPWCCRSLLHHGSSHRRLHRGPPSWLVSGLPPANVQLAIFCLTESGYLTGFNCGII